MKNLRYSFDVLIGIVGGTLIVTCGKELLEFGEKAFLLGGFMAIGVLLVIFPRSIPQ